LPKEGLAWRALSMSQSCLFMSFIILNGWDWV